MASVNAIALSAMLLVLLPMTATSSFLAPLLSPVIGDVCQKAECGKGKCKPSDGNMFLYECECDLGWKQTLVSGGDDLKFLPCVIPNCTMNYSCSEAAPPVQDKSTKSNESILDPCHWTDCGGGSCNKTSTFTYSCECAVGYNNLFNTSAFPCFKECSVGMDCAHLGIAASNKTTTPAPALADNSQNLAGSISLGYYHFLIILMMSLVMI